MHNCRRLESQLVDLLFDEVDAASRLPLLREIEDCASCLTQYQSLSDTLFIAGRTMQAQQPPESYWPRYQTMLDERLRAPVAAASEQERPGRSFWKRLFVMRLPLPVPVAAAMVVGLIVTSALALRRAPVAPPAPAQTIETVRVVEVPVVHEKIVTRTVYVEKRRAAEREQRVTMPAAIANTSGTNDAAATTSSSPPEEETGFFTSANLKGFQPPDEMKIRVIKRSNTDDK